MDHAKKVEQLCCDNRNKTPQQILTMHLYDNLSKTLDDIENGEDFIPTLVNDVTAIFSFPHYDNLSKTLDDIENKDPFMSILQEMYDTHRKKSHDYGAEEDPYYNLRQTEEMGIPAWQNTFFRMLDKVARIKSFIKKGKLENESVEDAFMDLAVYAIIALVLKRKGTK